MSKRQGALCDLRVIDLTQMFEGPFATRMLADQGAEVIKIEPLDGDRLRSAGSGRIDHPPGSSSHCFQRLNRNKASMAIDLDSEMGREILLRLIRGADVVIESLHPGTMQRPGLIYETLREFNPRLVHAILRDDGPPCSGELAADIGRITSSMSLAFGIVTAVHHAVRTGQGQFLHVSTTDAALPHHEPITPPLPAFKLAGTPGGIYQPAPLLGGQTTELLLGLGLSRDEIESLRTSDIVR